MRCQPETASSQRGKGRTRGPPPRQRGEPLGPTTPHRSGGCENSQPPGVAGVAETQGALMTYPDIPEPARHVGRPPEAPLDGPGGTPQSPPLTQRGPTTRSAPGAAAEAPPGSGQPESGQHGSGTSAEALPGSDQHGSGTTSGAKEQGKQVAQDAKEQAKHVAQDAKESGKQVAQTTQEEVRNVGATVSEQVRNLLSETSSEISSQAGSQQQRLAEGLRAL